MTIILSLFPNTRGLGYACVEMPKKLIDSGVVTVQPVSSERIFVRATKFIEFFSPTVILIRDVDVPVTRRGRRIQDLIAAISDYAKKNDIPIYRYSRQQIQDVFEQFGANNKYEIAQRIIEGFPQLAARAPKLRKTWMDEDYNMGVFDALSLIVTHLYLTE